MDTFKLWCWRRFLRVPWTARRSNQSIPKEINPEYSLEGLILKLKLQYFGHLMWRADSLEKTMMLGKIEGKKEKGTTRDEMVGWHQRLNGLECEQILGDSEGEGSLVCHSSWGCSQTWTTQQLQEQLRCLDTHKKPLSTTPELMLMKCLWKGGERGWRLAKVQWPVT